MFLAFPLTKLSKCPILLHNFACIVSLIVSARSLYFNVWHFSATPLVLDLIAYTGVGSGTARRVSQGKGGGSAAHSSCTARSKRGPPGVPCGGFRECLGMGTVRAVGNRKCFFTFAVHISSLCMGERHYPQYKKIDGAVLTSESENNLECAVTFQTDSILQRFMLRFEKLALDCHDHLVIFDGAHAIGNHKVLNKMCYILT